MGGYIERTRSTVTTRYNEFVDEYYSRESYQFQLRRDQMAILGMVLGLVGVFAAYIGATNLTSPEGVPLLVLGVASSVAARGSIKRGLEREN